MNATELGELVKAKRGRMSQRRLAKHLGISPTIVSRIENGIGWPTAETLLRLCTWLQIPIDNVAAHARRGQVIYYPNAPTPNIVASHLMADPNLTPEAAKRLTEYFRAVYGIFSGAGR